MTFTIGEIAERSGFTPSALRYYERIGLVAPAARSDGGYRLYDDRTLARLTFIERAKQLGCSLDDIADLVTVWERDECGPVQQRFHGLVTSNLEAARQQIAELTEFAGQLGTAAGQLATPATDGPCGPGCACISGQSAESPKLPVALGRPADVPIACSLDPTTLSMRLDDWQAVLAEATGRSTTTDGGLRIEFGDGVDVGRLGQLVSDEQRCCEFFTFAITVDSRGVALEVRAPDDATEVVAALFGRERVIDASR